MFQYWWSWTKYSLLVVFATTILGCLYAVLGIQLLFSINFPDYYIETHGKEISILHPAYACPTAYMGTFFRAAFALLCGTCLSLLHIIYSLTYLTLYEGMAILATGMGTAGKYIRSDSYADKDRKKFYLSDEFNVSDKEKGDDDEWFQSMRKFWKYNATIDPVDQKSEVVEVDSDDDFGPLPALLSQQSKLG